MVHLRVEFLKSELNFFFCLRILRFDFLEKVE
jgi:hypothetical protein